MVIGLMSMFITILNEAFAEVKLQILNGPGSDNELFNFMVSTVKDMAPGKRYIKKLMNKKKGGSINDDIDENNKQQKTNDYNKDGISFTDINLNGINASNVSLRVDVVKTTKSKSKNNLKQQDQTQFNDNSAIY
jgi:hypothetical protein